MIKNVVRNIMPAIAVMVAGLLGAWMVFDGFYSDNVNAVRVSQYEPAAGEEVTIEAEGDAISEDEVSVEDDAAEAVDEWEYFTDESTATEAEGEVTTEAEGEIATEGEAVTGETTEAEAADETHDHMGHEHTEADAEASADAAVEEETATE